LLKKKTNSAFDLAD